MKNLKITGVNEKFIREPLKAPFGFKGRYLSELWQSVPMIKSENFRAACPGTVSVLWSDANVFAEHADSSALMNKVTLRALDMINGESFVSPDSLIAAILPDLKKYADSVCGREVAGTFVLNSLVGIDYALWSLYALENGIKHFDGIIPDYARKALSNRHAALAHIPLVSYAVDENALRGLLESGTGLLKIKIGKLCGDGLTKDEDMESMLEWDKARLTQIHNIAKNYSTELSKTGKVRYYLDANGRYDGIDRLESLLDHAERIGALESIELVEEPFAPGNEIFVGDLPVTVNADESAHSLDDVKKSLQLGYKAVALKPIAKTMSVSFAMAAEIESGGGQCLCADLTVVPLLAEWNKQFAARVAALDGMSVGCIEVNGDQNYVNWDALCKKLPAGMDYIPEKNGRFVLEPGYYSGECKLFNENEYINLF